MKKLVYTIALLWGLQVSQTVQAQNEQVTLHVPNFVRPLVEKWVAEYQKTNTQVDFQFNRGNRRITNPTVFLLYQMVTTAYSLPVMPYCQ